MPAQAQHTNITSKHELLLDKMHASAGPANELFFHFHCVATHLRGPMTKHSGRPSQNCFNIQPFICRHSKPSSVWNPPKGFGPLQCPHAQGLPRTQHTTVFRPFFSLTLPTAANCYGLAPRFVVVLCGCEQQMRIIEPFFGDELVLTMHIAPQTIPLQADVFPEFMHTNDCLCCKFPIGFT